MESNAMFIARRKRLMDDLLDMPLSSSDKTARFPKWVAEEMAHDLAMYDKLANVVTSVRFQAGDRIVMLYKVFGSREKYTFVTHRRKF